MEHEEQGHKRRVRYRGTHPKTFGEKYKELAPEKHADTVAKLLQKGKTPAGMHIPICVNEILDFLQIQPGQIGLDATLGYGGHASELLKQLESKGHLYALDVDPIEIVKTRERLERLGYGSELLTIQQLNFADVDRLAPQIAPLDFVLADLGVSSMQIDNPDRGFSYKKEGPLDLRLNPERGISAAQRLRDITQAELEGMLLENADEPFAEEIAKAVVAQIRRGNEIATTSQLRQCIEGALSFLPANARQAAAKKSCQRSFQALRIDVNGEFEALGAFLEQVPQLLAPGGRLAILTFHSGEDRLVKQAFKQHLRNGIYSEIATDVIRPTAEECSRNSRAHSTKMRWAIKA